MLGGQARLPSSHAACVRLGRIGLARVNIVCVLKGVAGMHTLPLHGMAYERERDRPGGGWSDGRVQGQPGSSGLGRRSTSKLLVAA